MLRVVKIMLFAHGFVFCHTAYLMNENIDVE